MENVDAQRWWQFSTREMLGATGIACLYSACVAYVGLDLVALACCMAFIYLAWAKSRARSKRINRAFIFFRLLAVVSLLLDGAVSTGMDARAAWGTNALYCARMAVCAIIFGVGAVFMFTSLLRPSIIIRNEVGETVRMSVQVVGSAEIIKRHEWTRIRFGGDVTVWSACLSGRLTIEYAGELGSGRCEPQFALGRGETLDIVLRDYDQPPQAEGVDGRLAFGNSCSRT